MADRRTDPSETVDAPGLDAESVSARKMTKIKWIEEVLCLFRTCSKRQSDGAFRNRNTPTLFR